MSAWLGSLSCSSAAYGQDKRRATHANFVRSSNTEATWTAKALLGFPHRRLDGDTGPPAVAFWVVAMLAV